jgi:hypothetical protein
MDPSGQDVITDTVNVLAHFMISRGALRGFRAVRACGEAPGHLRRHLLGHVPRRPALLVPVGEVRGRLEEAFRKAAPSLVTKLVGLSLAGSRSFLFFGLPKLHLKAEFFEADEEFGTEILPV